MQLHRHRREFITLLGGVVSWPLAARAQQSERVRRIAILLNAAADDPRYQPWVGAFLQALALLGWTIGRNVRIDTRWSGVNAAETRRHAAELAALAPDVILAHGSSTVGPLLQATRTVPIVFPVIADPVGIVTAGAATVLHSNLIITLAARHKLPAVYNERSFAVAGGLVSYGPDFVDQYRRAAGYVDRIHRGEKPADLPVQAPTKYELVINLKTAKALGLDVAPTLLARADEVIE
jgi:ABC-type uncharacterized transport system substrate-binding protein